jgi:transposase
VADVHARGTSRLDETLRDIAFACGGEAGARLARRLSMPTSADTLIRRIRRTTEADEVHPRVLGVDDWAVRKGQRYGTILCDLERHRPIDMLHDREAKSLAGWLQAHPEVEVISRDRARFYAEGATTGAPQALQVADRFHLMQNLRQALVRTLERRYRDVLAAAQDAEARRPSVTAKAAVVEEPRSNRRRHRLPRSPTKQDVRRARRVECYQQVWEFHRQGISRRAIARRLGIDRETVERYLRAEQFPERSPRRYASRTDPFVDYLRKRWNEGCQNAAQLMRELAAYGFKGSYCSVRRKVAHWERAGPSELGHSLAAKPPAVHPPSANQLAWLLLKERDELDDNHQLLIDVLLQRCPEVAEAAALARDFAAMVRRRQGGLDAWIQRAWASTVPRELRAFATGLKSDYAAVNAGLTTGWSNGQVEGQVNRLKLIKRQMYGRAKFDLLRRRVLHTG